MSEERDFEVVDRRRRDPADAPAAAGSDAGESPEPGSAAAEPDTSPGAATAEQAGEPADQEEDGGEAFTDEDGAAAGPTDVVQMLGMVLGMLNEIAWVKMGLVPDPMIQQLAPDLKQARLAIDCAGDLAHRLENHIEPGMRREVEVMVQNLKLNYVKKSSEQAP